MAYYSINKYNVFFSDDRFAEIDKPYIEKLTALERFGLTSIKSQSLIQLYKLRISKLEEDFKNLDRDTFIKKWVVFEFQGNVAKSLGYNIIYDYFHIHKNGYVFSRVDLNSSNNPLYYYEQFIDDILSEDDDIYLNFNIYSKKKPFIRLLDALLNSLFYPNKVNFENKTILRKTICSKKILNIKGSLKDLQIRTENEVIKLGKIIEIISADNTELQ